MPRVMIRCPKTKKLVPTGHVWSKFAFDNPTYMITNETFRCPSCGETHTWSKKDAFLEAT